MSGIPCVWNFLSDSDASSCVSDYVHGIQEVTEDDVGEAVNPHSLARDGSESLDAPQDPGHLQPRQRRISLTFRHVSKVLRCMFCCFLLHGADGEQVLKNKILRL